MLNNFNATLVNKNKINYVDAILGETNNFEITLKGQEFMCIDSNVKHPFSFTPSFSIFVTCNTEEELDKLYQKLNESGQALMPLGNYGFSKKFGWVNDRFGVSWQLNLPK